MKIINCILFVATLCSAPSLHSQGFVNLNFESAQVSGYPSGEIPIGQALPGWSGFINSSYFGMQPQTIVYLNGLSLGSPQISLFNAAGASTTGISPLQGSYSAFLFGATLWEGNGPVGFTTGISQTGLVPANAQSLQIDIGNYDGYHNAPFSIMLGGQTLNMVPLSYQSSYTVYGANISSLAGETCPLSILALPGAGDPSMLLIDDIKFSPFAVVPEPGTWVLLGTGLTIVVLFRGRNGLA